jgi:quaternary ammonium compound-resistance protein SugE
MSYLSVRGRPRTAFIAQFRDGPALTKEGLVMAWIYLLLAGLLEIVWAFFMKKSAGFTLPIPSAITIVTMIASFALLSVAMKSLPLGTAYTIWTGIGAVGAFALGVIALGEAATPLRLIAGALIVSGIVLMKLSSTT